MDLRKQGAPKKESRAILAPTGPFAELGETQIPGDQIAALRSLYHQNPSMQAARSILLGQLLSSGIVVRRKGEDVALTESFAKHLEGVWLPFARQVFDELMVQGFVAISIEEETPEPFAALLEKRKGGKRPRGQPNVIPVVTEPGTVQVSFLRAGRNGYARRYAAKSLAPGIAYGFDDEIGIFVRGHPDSSGNIRSPVATCFNSASFVAALMELALQAEVVRARTLLVTQVAQRPGHTGTAPLSAADLFYDSESRALQQADAQGEAQEQATSLNLLTKLCARLNQLQTTNQPGSSGPPPAAHAPPEVPPRLFTLPEKQQLAPAPQQPQSRTDLEALLRQSNDAVCASFGVPASVIFEGARPPLAPHRDAPADRRRAPQASSPPTRCRSCRCARRPLPALRTSHCLLPPAAPQHHRRLPLHHYELHPHQLLPCVL